MKSFQADVVKEFNMLLDYTRDIDRMISDDELYWLYSLSRHTFKELNVVELGTYTGVSAIFIAAGLKEAYKMTTVDICKYSKSNDTIEIIQKANADLGLKIEFIKSNDLAFVDSLPDYCIDRIFIDSDHNYEHINQIFEHVMRKMSAGGLMMFHDYTPAEAGEVRAITEFVEVYGDLFNGFGLNDTIWWGIIKGV